MFKVGERVIIHKPRDRDQYPTWSDSMNKYDGYESEIDTIRQDSYGYSIMTMLGCGRFVFRDSWLEQICEQESCESEELQAFLSEFKVCG